MPPSTERACKAYISRLQSVTPFRSAGQNETRLSCGGLEYAFLLVYADEVMQTSNQTIYRMNLGQLLYGY